MKTIRTANYLKISKDKAEDFNVNPWAVCTKSVGRDNKEKYEKCVKDVKKKERKSEDENNIKESRGKATINWERPAWNKEEDWDNKLNEGLSEEGEKKKEDELNDKWSLLLQKMKKRKEEPVFAKRKSIIIEAKKKK